MWDDPIVDEIRRIREAHAAQFNYDVRAIARDIQEREARSGRRYVTLPPRRVSDQAPEAATEPVASGRR